MAKVNYSRAIIPDSEHLTVGLLLLKPAVVTKYRNKFWHGAKSKHGQKHPRGKKT